MLLTTGKLMDEKASEGNAGVDDRSGSGTAIAARRPAPTLKLR